MIRVIAVDGPAASGKSSTASAVARRLGFFHIDSGALYRGVTSVALGLSEDASADDILTAAEFRGLGFRVMGEAAVLYIDGSPFGARIRDQEVTAGVSAVSAIPEVRRWVNRSLRGIATSDRTLVVDGRDIGTAVFPDAPVKVFLDAAPEVRARRRLAQRDAASGDLETTTIAAEAERLRKRDEADASRALDPLRPAEDATRIDTANLTFDQQVGVILDLIRRSPLHPGPSAG